MLTSRLQVFPPEILFDVLYAGHCRQAISGFMNEVFTDENFIMSLRKAFKIQYSLLYQNVLALEAHRQSLSKLSKNLLELRSHKSCLCCLMRSPEKVLACGHALCDICIKIFGIKLNKSKITLDFCVLCGLKQPLSQYKFIQDTAGLRILSLDGGGIRGVVTLEFLIHISREVSCLGCPLNEFFDYVCGTSAGMYRLSLYLPILNPVRRCYRAWAFPNAMEP